ncbi:ergosterol biosynthesis protein [Puccinia graminis f. sp. tritici]|uniref:Ergosterol biosynthesis protein n=1 Tax=Puccinia graminis f. sp. tritici TaxID=56615 RepID=A0A5B0SF18_PUCGR|nr:ergosterol biosynthesis protein [Puccinia graminis f. sp. tritici]KAA1136467.1 ergosterol biosynthesis protein [Puccinia graminis f. sp. tritici]
MARDIVIPILAGLPPHPGWLPKWMMLIAGVSILNGLQNYISLAGARKVYDRRPDRVTGLQSRNFGTWTITAGLVRLYAAYNISNPGLYHLALGTFAIALSHFVAEAVVYRTTGWGVVPPFIVASVSLGWMIKEYDHYLL